MTVSDHWRVRLHSCPITGVIQRLVDKRLMLRDRDLRDTRRERLRMPLARRFTGRSRVTVELAVGEVLRRVPPAHVHHARQVLRVVANALDGVSPS